MERRPRMTHRPPARLESTIGLLVPPVAREHLLGDLAERYESLGRYLMDALQTVPAAIISQIRRTSFFLLWPIIGTGLVVAFGRGAEAWWPRAAIPAATTLLAFMVRDACRVPDLEHPKRKGLADIAIVAAVVMAVQWLVGISHPEWLITTDGWRGGALALSILYALRLQNPAGRVPRFS